MMNPTNYCTQWTEDVLPMLWITHKIEVLSIIEYFIQLCIDADGFWNPWMWVPLTLLCRDGFLGAKKDCFFFTAKGWCSSFTEALLSCFSCFFYISLSLSLSQWLFCHSFILFNHACCSCGTNVVNNLINVPDQYASNYTTLRRNQWKKSCCFSLSVLFHPLIALALVSLYMQQAFSDSYQQYDKENVAILINMRLINV